jgi:hypothetical protein
MSIVCLCVSARLQYGLQYGRGLDRLWHQGLLAGLGRWWRDGFSTLPTPRKLCQKRLGGVANLPPAFPYDRPGRFAFPCCPVHRMLH